MHGLAAREPEQSPVRGEHSPTRRSRLAVALVLGGALLLSGPAYAEGKLELLPDPTLLALLLIGFALLVFPVHVFVFRPLLQVLDERADRIDGAKRRAEQLARDAEAALARYREMVREERESAERERRAQLEAARGEHSAIAGAARSEAGSASERSRVEIAEALEEARGKLRRAAEQLAREAAERILGRSLS